MRNRASCFLLVGFISFLTLASTSYALTGSGTKASPYLIASFEDFEEFRTTTAYWATGVYTKLETDIDLDPALAGRQIYNAAPIAGDTDTDSSFDGTAYAGHFDGNGHIIRNLVLYGANYCGLFGKTDTGSEIKNLELDNVSITGTSSYVGGLVGYVYFGSISDSYSTGSVTGEHIVGGLVGYAFYGSIRNSYASGAVIGTNYVGGLIGQIDYSTITNCYYSSGVAVWGTGYAYGTSYVGGLIGQIYYSAITNCYSSGEVYGTGYVGGLIGQIYYYSTITNCYSSGVVSGAFSTGGLVGYNYYGNIKSSFWDIETSGITVSDGGIGKTTAEMQAISTFINAWDFIDESANGTSQIWRMPQGSGYPELTVFTDYVPITLTGDGSSDNPYQISTAHEFGAIHHYDRGAYYELMADVDLNGITWSTAVIDSFSGIFEGNGNSVLNLTVLEGSFPGLFGNVVSGGEINNLAVENASVTGLRQNTACLVESNFGDISNCFSTGTVSSDLRVGGLVGNNFGTVTNSYSTSSVSNGAGLAVGGLVGVNYNYGSITNCYSTGSVSGADGDVGGLVGYNSGTVTNSYSTGSVSGTDSANVGGLVGRDLNGTVTNSFWDIDTSGLDTSAGGIGLSTLDMKDIDTYLNAGWDFVNETANGSDNIWRILPNSYPSLFWLEAFVLDVTEISIEEGQTINFEVVLPYAPSSEIEVHFEVSGDSDFELLSSTEIAFDPNNWNQPQLISLRSNYDENYLNDQGVLRIASSNYSIDVPILEADIQPLPPESLFEITPSSLEVIEGQTATFTVRLKEDPLGTVNVNVVRVSGDDDIKVVSGGTFVFDSTNYNITQEVTVEAVKDFDRENDVATLEITATNLPQSLFEQIQVTEQDIIVYQEGQLPSGTTVWNINEPGEFENIIIPSDGTLIIGSGATLKLEGTSNVITVQGVLEINGTVENPVVITSFKDDLNGDTNGDGTSTSPVSGDWQGFRIEGNGKIKIDNAIIKYAQQGVEISGPDTECELNNVIITDCYTYGIYSNQLNTTLTANNCLIADNGYSGVYLGNDSFVYNKIFRNCTITNNGSSGGFNSGIYFLGTHLSLESCIVANNNTYGVWNGGGTPDLSVSYSDIYQTIGSAFYGINDIFTGVDGNISIDPLFIDPANRNYELSSGSFCIDSAYGSSITAADIRGFGRHDDTGMPNIGKGFPWYTDMGAYERQEDTETADLAISYMSSLSPTIIEPNEIFSFNRTITNEGNIDYTSSWQEKIYLSDDQYLSPEDRLLNASAYNGPFDPNQHGYRSFSINMPHDESGLKYIIYHLIPDDPSLDINQQNNITASMSPVAVNLPYLDVNNPISDSVISGEWKYYRYSVEDLRTVRFVADLSVNNGAYLYGVYEDIPTVSQYDFKADQVNSISQIANLSMPISGNYYIGIYGNNTGSFTLSAEYAGLEIISANPQTVGNSGTATIQIKGVNFEPSDQVLLVTNGSVIAAGNIYFETTEEVYAQFDFTSSPINSGNYDLKISDLNEGSSFTLPDSITVIDGGQSEFFATIQLPGIARPGRVVNIQLTYGNQGTADLNSPILTLTGPTNCEWQLPNSDKWQVGDKIRMLALSSSGPANILRPGQTEIVNVKFRTPLDYTANNITIQLYSLGTKQGDGSELETEWSQWYADTEIVSIYESNLGMTWDEYIDNLGITAEYFAYQGLLCYDTELLEEYALLRVETQTLEFQQEYVPAEKGLEATSTIQIAGEPGTVYALVQGISWQPAVVTEINQNTDPNRNTVVIIHGMNNNILTPWIGDMGLALYNRFGNSINILAVGWGEWSDGGFWRLNPFRGAYNIPKCAKIVRETLFSYSGDGTLGLNPQTTHLIGHSHGSHVAGLIGKYQKVDGSSGYKQGVISRITALDASESSVHRTSENLLGSGWDPFVASYVEFYKSSALFGTSSDKGIDNFLIVEDGTFWGQWTREFGSAHGYANQWYTETIGGGFGGMGFNWSRDSWNNAIDNFDVKFEGNTGLPWKGLIRNNVIENFSIGLDAKYETNESWKYPGGWDGGFNKNISGIVDDLAKCVELEPSDLSITAEDGSQNFSYSDSIKVMYTITNYADNRSISRLERMKQRNAHSGLSDTVLLSTNASLDPPPDDIELKQISHWDFLGAQGESDNVTSMVYTLELPSRGAIEAHWNGIDINTSDFYIIVDVGSTRGEKPYEGELYPKDNIIKSAGFKLDADELSADAGGPYTAMDNDENNSEFITLDGSLSVPEGLIIRYEWSTGETDKTVSHSFPVGTYKVTLTVYDADDNFDSATAEVTILDKDGGGTGNGTGGDPPIGGGEGGGTVPTRWPIDPEDKFGPSGYDDPNTPEAQLQRFIAEDETINYRIEFWNHEDAVVPAQVVTMRDTIDLNQFDISTLEFTRIGFLKWDIELPKGTRAIDKRIDLRPEMNLVVDITTTVDYETGFIMWRLQCSDPDTGDYPEDPYAGFLPPFNPETAYELGWMEFRVKPVGGLSTGTVISNRAYGEFDDMGDWPNNPAPKDGPWINTIDAGTPSSNVLALPVQSENGFMLEWVGQDDVGGSGIVSYEIYASENNQLYQLRTTTSDTSAIFNGNPGSSYRFYSIAIDGVGHKEYPPLVADAETFISIPSDAGGYWRFEEGVTDSPATIADSIIDSVGLSDNGSPSGSPVYRSDTPVNIIPSSGLANDMCLEFDGQDDSVYFDSAFPFHAPGDATIEFWLRFTPTSHQSVLWSRSDTSDTNRFNFFVNGDGTFGFDYRSPGGSRHVLIGGLGTGTQIPEPQTWTHVAIVRSGDTYRLYFDGILAEQVTDNNPELPDAVGWSIAKSDGSGYGGLIDELRFTTSALTPHEFLLYNQACPGDFTMDGMVNIADLARFAGYWLSSEQLFDIAPVANPDGTIEVQDLRIIAENWLNMCN